MSANLACQCPQISSMRQCGFSLVELMVSLALGLIVVGAVTLLFVNNSRARQESEKTSQQIENGRYATQLLIDEFKLAGYFGEFDPTGLATPAALPDPTVTDGTALASDISLTVQGYDGGAGMPASLTTLLADRRTGTDVVVVRRASACTAGSSGCDSADITRYTYFQTSLCATQRAALATTGQFVIGTTMSVFTTSNAALTGAANPPAFLAKKDCSTAAALRSMVVRIYFVANNNATGDGIPTLKIAELGAGAFVIVPLVEGIEQFQVQYGLDANLDGAPESYTSAPATVGDWRKVVTVKTHILARTTDTTLGFTDTRTYVLGAKADGTDQVFGPYNDAYKRHAYSSVIRLNNVAGRLE